MSEGKKDKKSSYEIYMKESRRKLEESNKFTSNESNRELLLEIIELTDLIKGYEDALKQKRAKLLDIMIFSDCAYAVDMSKCKSATISKSGYNHSSKFDEKRFKSDHPDLYERYLVHSRSRTSGGRLTITNLTDKQLKAYNQILSNDKEEK